MIHNISFHHQCHQNINSNLKTINLYVQLQSMSCSQTRSIAYPLRCATSPIMLQTFMDHNNHAEHAPVHFISYIQINHQGQDYRANLERYQKKKINMLLACLTQAQIIILTLLYLFLQKYYQPTSLTMRYLPLLIEVNVFTIVMTSLVLFNRSSVPLFNLLSVLAVTGYLVALTVLFEKEIACQWIAAIAFGSVELAIAIVFIKLKWCIIPFGLLAAQLIVAVFNAEGKLSLSWLIALSILIGIVFVGTAVAITLFIMGLYEYFKQDGYRFFALQTIYLGLIQLGYAADAAVIVLLIAFQAPTVYVIPPCAGYNLFLILFTCYFRHQIILFKSKAAIIISQRNKYNFEKIVHKKVLFKNSSNWFNPQVQDQKTYLGQQKIRSSIREETKCVICLCDVAQMVWLPCGHLTVCEGCGQYLMDNGKLDCVICKTKGQEIFHIIVQGHGITPKFQSDFCYKITTK